MKLLFRSPQKSTPFDRFEKRTGAMFSELSTSSTSDAFRLTGEDAIASACQRFVTAGENEGAIKRTSESEAVR